MYALHKCCAMWHGCGSSDGGVKAPPIDPPPPLPPPIDPPPPPPPPQDQQQPMQVFPRQEAQSDTPQESSSKSKKGKAADTVIKKPQMVYI